MKIRVTENIRAGVLLSDQLYKARHTRACFSKKRYENDDGQSRC